jgi:hypothetical protein
LIGKADLVVTVRVNVRQNPFNARPQSRAIPEQSAAQGNYFNLDLTSYFSDSDDRLTYYSSGLASGGGLNMYSSGTDTAVSLL